MTVHPLETSVHDADQRLIPLHKLSVHVHNARRTDKRRDIETLAASIAAHGLLQNLTVVQMEDERYGVIAGGRRLTALKLLAKQGHITRDHEIPCTLIAEDAAQEASLAENVQRVPMNVMDEVEAFAALADAGASSDAIARRFGIPIRHVEQRLALAHLSPKIRAAYRKGDITLDVARAFCLAEDHAAQERLFKQMAKPITHAPSVRAALTSGRISTRDRVALFVGLDAYEAAGGRLVRDLFEEGAVFLEDGAILQRLAHVRLEAAREFELSSGWGWAEVVTGRASVEGCVSERLQPVQRRMNAAEKRQIEETRAEIVRIDAALDDESDNNNPLLAERDTAEARLDSLLNHAMVWDRRLIAHAGVALTIDHNGRLIPTRGLIKRTALKKIEKLRNVDADVIDDPGAIGGGADTSSEAERLPKALVVDLTAARTRAVRAAVAQHPHVALALLVHALSRARNGTGVAGVGISSRPKAFGEAQGHAALQAATEVEEIGDGPERWRKWLATPANVLQERLAVLVAETLDLSHEGASAHDGLVQTTSDRIAAAVQLDMTQCWTADEPFWLRAPKTLALRAVETAPSVAALPAPERVAMRARLAKLKKGERAAVVTQLLAGGGWLPEVLITPLDVGALILTDAAHAEVGDAS